VKSPPCRPDYYDPCGTLHGGAVYFSVMRRRKNLPQYRTVLLDVAVEDSDPEAGNFLTSAKKSSRPRKAAKA
jgi:hypothetical protein